MFKKNIMLLTSIALTSVSGLSLHAYDFLLEAKSAYFLSTNRTFRDIYHNGGGIYGAEGTFQLYDTIYGFMSTDFLTKTGHTVNFCNKTKVNIINLGVGLKYMAPFDGGNFYIGLGALPTRLHTTNDSPYVTPEQTKWGCGGITKIGAYFDVLKSFALDLFFNYSFVTITPKDCNTKATQPNKAHLSGCWFGAALGYRFN